MVAAQQRPAAATSHPAQTSVETPTASNGHIVDEPPPHRVHAPQKHVRPRDETWGVEYPFTSRWLAVNGPDRAETYLHFIDEGPRDAPVIVFLHGNPTWSFYWRKLIVALRTTHRCIAIDHLGCGLSDRPQHWSWTLEDRIGHVHSLLGALRVQDFSLVVHDWGGAIGMGVATRMPTLVNKIVVTNTAAFRSADIPPSIASLRIPLFGRMAVLHFNAFARAATFRAVAKPLSPTAQAGLLAPYGNAHDRLSTLTFVEDIPMKPAHRSYATLVAIEDKLETLKSKPMLIVWGDKDFCFTPKFRQRWQALFPAAEVHAFSDVGHYVNEDAPERIIPLLTRFFAD